MRKISFLLPFLLFPLLGNAQSISSTDIAKVESVRPDSVELILGGSAVEVKISGSNLNRSSIKAEILKNGRIADGIQASLDPAMTNDDSLLMILYAGSSTEIGSYTVRFRDGRETILLPLKLEVVDRSQPSQREAGRPTTRRQLTVKPAMKVRPEVKSSSTTPSTVKPPEGSQKRSVTKSSGRLMGKPSRAVKITPHLSVNLPSLNDEKWGTEWKETEWMPLRFRWSVAKGDIPVTGRWQVSRSADFDAILIDGDAGNAPESGQYQFFYIDFKKIAAQHAIPDELFVRLLPVSESTLYIPSASVSVSKIAPGPGTFFSTKGINPELWNPVPIRVTPGSLHIISADEEDDEEPYIVMAVIYADGTSIDLLNMSNSSIRMQSTSKTHGNIWSDGDLGTGDSPHLLEGPWNTTILPVGLNALELLEAVMKQAAPDTDIFLRNTFVAVLAIAMEEDASATEDIDSIKNTLLNSLRNEINGAIQAIDVNMTITGGGLQKDSNGKLTFTGEGTEMNLPAADLQSQFNQIIQNVMSAVKNELFEIMKQKALWLPFTIGQLADPDNFVGAYFGVVSYKQIMDAAPSSVRIPMDFNDCGDCDAHYSFEVTIRKM